MIESEQLIMSRQMHLITRVFILMSSWVLSIWIRWILGSFVIVS
jgi:hypothetical protein